MKNLIFPIILCLVAISANAQTKRVYRNATFYDALSFLRSEV